MLIAGMMAACLFGFTANARAVTDTVTSTSDSGIGSLREVTKDANEGDTIAFAPSLNDQTIVIASAIVIDKSLTLEGPGASHLTIDGNHASQIFIVSAGDLSISGLTLANGATPENGGAINFESTGSLSIANSTFTGNTAGGDGSTGGAHGGAIYTLYHSSSLAITGSTFADNSAGGDGGSADYTGRSRGGAIEYDGEGSVTVTGSTFTGNTAGGDGGGGYQSGQGLGGAIYLLDFATSTSVSDSEFRSNTAGGDGGAGNISGRGEGGAIVDPTGEALTISDSTFRENVTGGDAGGGTGSGRGAGGAIWTLGGGSLEVTDSTFLANEVSKGAGGSGGAIYVWNKSLTVSGSTFAANTVGWEGASGSGGAIDAGAIPSLKVSASISNSTLFGNDVGGVSASGQGGAIDISDLSSATLASVTIAGNGVGPGGSGAGINSDGGVSPGGALVTAKATIISGNAGTGATNCDVPVASSSYSLEGLTSGDTSCGFDLPSADPELVGPPLNHGGPTKTQELAASSPAVDAVPVPKCPTKVDQRGEPRPDNGKAFCDVGAYELQDPPVAPAVTSAAAATFQAAKAASFPITATGLPAPSLSAIGALPNGVSFTDKGDGTASLSGTPAAGTGGSYPITIKASNGALPDATQSFTLTVQAAPTASISTPVDGATYTKGQAVSASFTCAEGAGGPGIASCVDQDGRASGAPLDTAATGRHTLAVTATSKDGLASRASVAYTVVEPGMPKVPLPRVLVSYRQEGGIGAPRPSLIVTKDHRARVTFRGCTTKFALRPAAWSKLRAALSGAHLHAIAGNYPPPKGSADVITYVIKASGEVVRIAPPQPEHEEVMRDLRPLLKVLNKMVSTGERRMPLSCSAV
jgi:hypothetical protein